MSAIKLEPMKVEIEQRVVVTFDEDERPAVPGDRLPSGGTRVARVAAASLKFRWNRREGAWIFQTYGSSLLIEQQKVDGTWMQPKQDSWSNSGLRDKIAATAVPEPLTEVVIR